MKCEVCSNEEYIAGVASSVLGAFSICWCTLCLKMGAEPKWAIEGTIEICGGLENVNPDLELIYFENDKYINYRTNEVVPILFKDGREFNIRSEAIVELEKRNK